ncbi:BnaC09g17840D [Brassica napus]|uniref:BnaC09g17840D protein n=1 Tax=Brassica napus TaxID=3708 RepID=A0A078HJF3_BRANA|nr:BnaC09g17840D [Brassica napus]
MICCSFASIIMPSRSSFFGLHFCWKQVVLKEVHETELFKHISKFFSSMDYEDILTYSAAKACCQGAEILSGCSSKGFCCQETCVKCVKGSGEAEGTVVTGVVVRNGNEQRVDLLVPATQNDCECGPKANYPAGEDVFTVLLLALTPQTWLGITDQALMHEMKQLVSMASLPTMLQEEVLHLRRQLQLLKRCQENKEEEDFAAPAY